MDPNSTPAQIQQDPYYAQNDGGGIFANKKKLLFIVLGIILFLIVASFIFWFIFGRGPKVEEEVRIVYWGVWEDAAVLQPIFDEFQKQHPNITIQYEKQDIKTLGDYVTRLKTRASERGDGAPDIVRFHSSWLLQLQNILAPFPQDVVAETGLEKDYFHVVENDLKGSDGAYYGLPLSIDTLALYVNTDLLSNIGASPPTAWAGENAIDDLARELTVVDAGNIVQSGVAMGTYENISHASDIISLLLLQNGANFRNLAGSCLECTVNAIQYYTILSRGSTAVWNQSMDNSKIAFAGGRLAMYFGYAWDIYEIKAANPNLNFQIVPVPRLPESPSTITTDYTIASYWAEGVIGTSRHQRAAFDLLKFMGRNETLQKIYENQTKARGVGSPYPKRALAESIKENNEVYPFTVGADKAVSVYFASDTFDGNNGMNQTLNIYLGNAINSITTKNTSATSAVETLSAGVNEVLSRYEESAQN